MALFGKTYQELVKLGKDALRETMGPLRAREMRLKAQMKIAELDSKIAEQEQQVVELGSAYPIDFDAMTRKMDDTALLKRQREQLGLIVAELFPTEGGA